MIVARAYLLVGAERWPDPGDPLGVERRLRRFQASPQEQLIAADFVARYQELMMGSHTARNRLVSQIRREQVEWIRRLQADL